jgi:hypothetical protein
MKTEQFVSLSDTEMDQVAGGASITLSLGEDGLSLDSSIVKISLPNPFKLVGDAVSTTLGTAGELLTKLGGTLTSAGQLFDFS